MKRNFVRLRSSCFPAETSVTDKMPVTRYYYPDVNLTLTAKYADKKSLANGTKYSNDEKIKYCMRFSEQDKV